MKLRPEAAPRLTLEEVQALFTPKATDVQYVTEGEFKISLICRMDSYKFAHPFAYPEDFDELGLPEGTEIIGMTSYGTARVSSREIIIPAGMQILTKRYLTQRITMADVDAAEKFSEAHFGRKLFARAAWEKVVNEYDGFLPLTIRSMPEGTITRGGMPLYTVTCLDKDLFWMSAGFETMIQRGVWYPTTIATNDFVIKKELEHFYRISGANPAMVVFALHDFGGRGVSCAEQAEIGGCAHTFNFQGSDTVEGILAANFFYKCDMAAFSVYATEHAVQCSYGKDPAQQIKYIKHQIKKAMQLGVKIVSIVLDGYDVYREAEACCTILRDLIIEFGEQGGKVVFRPDSGDMMEVVPRILAMQEVSFGCEVVTGLSGQKYKRIKYVGIIQGDGVDHMAIKSLMGKILLLGYTADCVIFGSGGALLQKVNRDTFKFAQKACAILVRYADGAVQWIGISKDPITDSGKKSLEGVVTTVRSWVTGEHMPARLDLGPLNEEFEDLLLTTYHLGNLYNETDMAAIRGRLAANDRLAA